jgi:hypothetical protein
VPVAALDLKARINTEAPNGGTRDLSQGNAILLVAVRGTFEFLTGWIPISNQEGDDDGLEPG